MHHIFVSENFIDTISSKVIIDKGSDSENFDHLAKSLRINIGEIVLCSPVPYNMIFSYKCVVSALNEDKIDLDILGKLEANELKCKINLYQGLPKSDKMELIIEKAVELGVYSITAVEMTNSVAKINDKTDKKLERYQKIAKSAAEQSKRNIVPEIKKTIDFKTMLSSILEGKGDSILFYENAAGIEETRRYLHNHTAGIINVIIGPEGGFTNEEIEEARDRGISILSLGNRILRTETAAITALSLLMYEKE